MKGDGTSQLAPRFQEEAGILSHPAQRWSGGGVRRRVPGRSDAGTGAHRAQRQRVR